jgi:hypothetical protein
MTAPREPSTEVPLVPPQRKLPVVPVPLLLLGFWRFAIEVS